MPSHILGGWQGYKVYKETLESNSLSLPALVFLDTCTTLRKYRNFRLFTRTADYPHWPIIAYSEKKSQQITRTGG